jgi:hypothetical protein
LIGSILIAIFDPAPAEDEELTAHAYFCAGPFARIVESRKLNAFRIQAKELHLNSLDVSATPNLHPAGGVSGS